MSSFLGLEIGGTKLQAAVGKGDGRLEIIQEATAHPERGRAGIFEQVVELAGSTLREAASSGLDVGGCGVGFGGPVDSARGVVLKSHQVTGWDDFPLAAELSTVLRLPTVVGNDSDLAGLAESIWGAGSGLSPIVYMNIGSGIGGAIVIDQRLYRGQGIGAAEIGHLRVVPGRDKGDWLTLESVCSGWALAEESRRLAESGTSAVLARLARIEGQRIGPPEFADALLQGDNAVHEVWQQYIERLGVAVANVVTLLHPRRFIVGGGVAQMGDALFNPLRAEVQRHTFKPFSRTCEIVPAALGQLVVPHGALRLAREAFEATADA